MKPSPQTKFNRDYQSHLKHLKLKGLQPKTIDAYARAIRSIGEHFSYQIDALSEQQLTDYFYQRLETHSWSSVKLDWYGLKFYYRHVLRQPWVAIDLVKPPRVKRLPDIITVEEANRLFQTTHQLSYKVFYFTLYSLGLRLGEGLRLEVGDIDAARQRVHIRNSKGNKDRLVPLPETTLSVLRRFWSVHRHPCLLFPNRKGGVEQAHKARTSLDRGGVGRALSRVVADCGIKKRLLPTASGIVMPLTCWKPGWICWKSRKFSATGVS